MNEKQFRVEIEALMAEKRYEEALELVQKQERQPEWIVLLAKIEALLHRRPTAEAHLLEYIFKTANVYRHEEITKRLLEMGHSEAEITQGFIELGFTGKISTERMPVKLTNQNNPFSISDTSLKVIIGLVIGIAVPMLCLYALTANCRVG